MVNSAAIDISAQVARIPYSGACCSYVFQPMWYYSIWATEPYRSPRHNVYANYHKLERIIDDQRTRCVGNIKRFSCAYLQVFNSRYRKQPLFATPKTLRVVVVVVVCRQHASQQQLHTPHKPDTPAHYSALISHPKTPPITITC